MIALRYEAIAFELREAVNRCNELYSTEGLIDMVALAFNSQGIAPSYGGAGGLPPGKYKGVIVKTDLVNVERMGQIVGGYLELHLTPIEGPLAGQVQIDRLNLRHSKPEVVEIANKQMAAYCHVLNVHAFQDTRQLENIPFVFEVGFQIDKTSKQPTDFTEVKKIFDANGNEAGKAGSGPTFAAQNQGGGQGPAAGGVQAQGQQPGEWAGGQQQQQQGQGGFAPTDQGGGQQQQQGGFNGQQGGGAGGGFAPTDNGQGGAGAGAGGNWGGGAAGGGQQQQQQQGGQGGFAGGGQSQAGGGWSPTGAAPGAGAGAAPWGR